MKFTPLEWRLLIALKALVNKLPQPNLGDEELDNAIDAANALIKAIEELQ